MRILVVADIHANRVALQAVLDRFGDADQIWCLGDVVEYGPRPAACIELVRDRCTHVVQGNHDVTWAGSGEAPLDNPWAIEWSPSAAGWLLDLPQTLTVNADQPWFLVHARPDNPLRGVLWPHSDPVEFDQALQQAGTDAILCGHTHMAFRHTDGRRQIINPGTIGQPRDGDYRAQCLLIDDGEIRFERVDYDLDALRRDYDQSGLSDELAATWFDYTRRGVVDVHGLQKGPTTPS